MAAGPGLSSDCLGSALERPAPRRSEADVPRPLGRRDPAAAEHPGAVIEHRGLAGGDAVLRRVQADFGSRRRRPGKTRAGPATGSSAA